MRAIRHWLLALFFLLAQAGALAHGVTHFPDQSNGHEPVCEQCLAFSSVGAGAASAPLLWSAPAQFTCFAATVPAASPACFQPCYQSRAPPSQSR
jgi:hypothetical protein